MDDKEKDSVKKERRDTFLEILDILIEKVRIRASLKYFEIDSKSLAFEMSLTDGLT